MGTDFIKEVLTLFPGSGCGVPYSREQSDVSKDSSKTVAVLVLVHVKTVYVI